MKQRIFFSPVCRKCGPERFVRGCVLYTDTDVLYTGVCVLTRTVFRNKTDVRKPASGLLPQGGS